MEVATISKNLILRGSPITSGTVSFATGATAATVVSANITAPSVPVSLYMVSIYNCATQTTIECAISNTRTVFSTSRAFTATSVAFTTGQAKDTMIEGLFAGASGARLAFSLGTAATAAEVVSAEYQIWGIR